jgi:SAM-dependent methyltransferase
MLARRMTDQGPYATPLVVQSADDCYFYHVMDLPGHGTVGGDWDLRGHEDEYLGNVELDGARVLEIGPANGCLTFHMEQRGAQVVGVDLPEGSEWDMVPLARLDPDAPHAWFDAIRRMRNGFWFAHRLHASAAKVHYGDVHNLPPELGRFDIGVMAAVLLHTRDPLGIVAACARICDTIVITDIHVPELDGQAVQQLFPTPGTTQWDTWWRFGSELFVQFLGVMGFQMQAVTFHEQTHVSDGVSYPMAMMTIVARRSQAPPAPPAA